MRIHLEMQQLVNACGGAKSLADKLNIKNPNTVYQWTESPDRSGRFSPIDRVMQLCHLLAMEPGEEGRNILIGMLREAIGCLGYTLVKQGQLDEIRAVLDNVSPRVNMDEHTPFCPHCDSPLRWVPEAGGWYCGTCRGK